MAVFSNEGLKDKVRFILGLDSLYSWQMRLFVTALTPSTSTVVGDYTECSLTGYSPYTFAPSGWTVSVASGLCTAAGPTVSFAFASYGGGTTIYGYYLVNTVDGKSVCGEAFATPYAVPATGGTLTVQPTFYDSNA